MLRGIFVVGTVLLSVTAARADWPAQEFNQLWVFGDSLSDVGNILQGTSNSNYFTPRPTSPYYDSGRFTDGPSITGDGATILTTQSSYQGVWAEDLASMLNVPQITASSAGGAPNNTDYATGGATTGGGTFGGTFYFPNLLTQINNFVASPTTPVASNPLYAVWAGGNDLLDAATATTFYTPTPAKIMTAESTAISNLHTAIQTLVNNGATQILWPNLPPLNATPFALGLPQNLQTALAQASAQFATDENLQILDLEEANQGLTIYPVNIYGFFNNVLANPAAYGYTNTTQSVITAGSYSAFNFTATSNFNYEVNPDQFLFWDQKHPTSYTHYLIAGQAFEAIPEPSATALVVGGLLAVLSRRYRASA